MTDTNSTGDVQRQLDDMRRRLDHLDADLRRRPRWTPNDVYMLISLVFCALMAVLLIAVPAVIQAVTQ